MANAIAFLTRTRGRNGRWDWTDWVSYGYLMFGVFIIFGPILWLMMSSFKTEADIYRYPPKFLPHVQETVMVDGYDDPLPLYSIVSGEHKGRTLAQLRRVGLVAQMIDPRNPDERLKVNISDREAIESVGFAFGNYTEVFERFTLLRYFYNSTFITLVTTAIALIANSMAAFALSKYQFRGRTAILMVVIGTLMIPQTVVLVPLFMVVRELGLVNNLWGVIIPSAATPTGVFLLRQYMLTIPDEILDAARMDKASEWKIFWRIILPLSAPAIAVLAILSIIWRWNDFLWPLIVLSENEQFTLQLALNSLQGESIIEWSYLLAMTVLTLLPVTVVFMFLQKYITTGIASTGGK